MQRHLIRAALESAAPQPTHVVIAAAPCHITQALAASLRARNATDELYLTQPTAPAEDASTASLEASQQLQQAAADAALEKVEATLTQMTDNSRYTGGRRIYALTSGMYGGEDPTQFAMLKAMVEQSAMGQTPEAVLVDTLDPELPEDERRPALEADTSLKIFLGNHGIRVHHDLSTI